MSNVKEFKLGELFCGPGGLALGAISARIEDPEYRIVHKWANDYDVSTCDTYRNITIGLTAPRLRSYHQSKNWGRPMK